MRLFDRRAGIAVGLLLLAFLVYALSLHVFRLDDSFITYRYARNVAAGYGLVYNPGEMVLSTTAPLYALILAGLSLLIPDFHLLGGILGTVCIAGGGILLTLLLPRRTPFWLQLWTGLAYILSTPLWLALGMETPLWIMLVLLAVYLTGKNRLSLAGLSIGAAILSRPDAALPGALLGLVVLAVTISRIQTCRRPWLPLFQYALSAALPVLLFYGWAWLTYGSPFPATLAAKSAQAVIGVTGFGTGTGVLQGLSAILTDLLQQSPLYIVVPVLMLAGILRFRYTTASLIVIWGVLHLLAYVVLGVSPYRWYFLPLLPGTILLMTYGLHLLLERLKVPVSVVIVIALIPMVAQGMSFVHLQSCFESGCEPGGASPVIDWQAYRQTGEWIDANTAPDAVIGVAEVGQIGFYARRYMTDYLGLLQPEVAQMLRRDDLYSWLVGYQPDYLVFQRFRGTTGLSLYNTFIQDDPWFQQSYQERIAFDDPRYHAAPVAIYERITPAHALHEQSADIVFGGLRLPAYATDSPVQTGETLRLRLNWQVIRDDLPDTLQLTVAIQDESDSIRAKQDRAYNTQYWQNDLVTWHGLTLPDTLTPGDYQIWVRAWVLDGPSVDHIIGTLTVTPDTGP